jgi:hypothetical protein
MSVDVQDAYRFEWERVDPFNIYPAPDATTVDDGYLIERHRLSRADLVALRGVEGYSTSAINAVLDEYGKGGLYEWLSADSEKRDAEGKPPAMSENPSELIDALQFWGSVQGKMLIDWGVSEEEVEDPLAEYHIEAWLIGRWVIKAVVNPDPLHRKPYYKASWEQIPGAFWGNSIPDLLCRHAGWCAMRRPVPLSTTCRWHPDRRSFMTSRSSRVGEDLTQMYPWKIWQVKDNGAGTTTQPISFFQPTSNAAELMGIYEKFATLADEYTGIPRYMTGDANVGGAGRTASGMSMLMSNAGKTIKNVVSTVDRVMKPAIERLYFYNMLYLDDPELKGDVSIHAEGANALVLKQQQQQRQNEFLNLVSTNPLLAQIVGNEGMAQILREIIKQIGFDSDDIVPSLPIMKARMAEQQIAAQQQAVMQQMQAQQEQANGQPAAGGTPAAPGNNVDQRRLADGSPQVNTMAVK